MFNSKKKPDVVNTSIINTIIGDNSRIEGVLYASESTRIDGLLQGKILSESSVIVGEHGTVKGDINAVEILVAGTVYGNLTATQRIEITETGCILGDLITKTLVIDEGASFKGNCTMEVMEEKKTSGDPVHTDTLLNDPSSGDQPKDDEESASKEAAAAGNKSKK